jgi:hypothetical protein
VPLERPDPPLAARAVVLTRRRLLALGAGAAAVVGGLVSCGASPSGPPATDPDLPRPSGAPLARGTVHDVRASGAVGDGRADDAAAFTRALALAAAGDTVRVPAGTYRLVLPRPLRVPPGVTLAGEPGRTTLRVTAGATAALLVSGDDVTLDGLEIVRADEAATVLVRVGQVARLTLSRLVLAGATDVVDTFCHGIQLGVDNGVSDGVTMRDCLLHRLTYGLYQANESSAVTVGVSVTGCTFARNTNTDLEFNSPHGSFRRVRVQGCTFRDNDSPGFAVGIAYCADVVVSGCTMTNYRMEAVHIEDWSSDVTVSGCTFSACGLREFAHVQVISGSARVTARANTHDATMNTRAIALVNALAGGDGQTAGGRDVVPPSAVTVADSTFRCSDAVVAVSFHGVTGGSITGNHVTGIPAQDALDLDGTTGVEVR